MRIAKQPGQPAHRQYRGGLVLLGVAALALVTIVLVVPLLTRSGGSETPATTLPGDIKSPPPSTTIGSQDEDEVAARLHQIFELRDRAIRTRNASLLEDIYTVDCPCLKGDNQLIQRLRRENLVWQGIRVSLRIDDVEQINERLWMISALVTTHPFKIERESGEVVRSIPRGKELSRFALAKPVGEADWLLGQASLIEGRG